VPEVVRSKPLQTDRDRCSPEPASEHHRSFVKGLERSAGVLLGGVLDAALVEERAEDVLLVREVQMEGPGRDPGGRRQLIHRHLTGVTPSARQSLSTRQEIDARPPPHHGATRSL
jgi:hypothetical protein